MRDETSGERRDRVWPGAVRWDLGDMRAHGGETLWQCDAGWTAVQPELVWDAGRG
jgi:hypothetical protein